jgi:hypothetical protein
VPAATVPAVSAAVSSAVSSVGAGR